MKIPIIPEKQVLIKKQGDSDLNLRAICVFVSTGFFLEKDSYFKNLEALQPATEYEFDEKGFITNSKKYWHWKYEPRNISLTQATEEFAELFEKVSAEKLNGKKIILPLSGGIDSRTQAAALNSQTDVRCYSYKFENSFDETKYGKEISKIKSFPFDEYVIKAGYLWNVIDELSEINKCYADFTHPRQMAVINEISSLGEIFFLGHWGDVLFDDTGVDENASSDKLAEIVLKKIIKRGGTELAEALWTGWGIEGKFSDYLKERISILLNEIKIDNANSKVRAFKSLYWAPRWTSANMPVFEKFHPLAIPYYDDRLCKFICTIPESILSGRQIQINYIKLKNPKLAEIPWQNFDPLNLYNYKKFDDISMLPSRAFKKVIRSFKKKPVTRNWEIQFKGNENDKNLRTHLFENKNFAEFIPAEVVKIFYNKFKTEDEVYYSHPVSMLLTLSMFCKKFMKQNDGLK